MTKLKLTKRVVKSSLPRATRYTVFDTENAGLAYGCSLREERLGCRYKNEGGRRATTKRLTIGKTDEFTPDEARKIADKFRSRVKVGQDPQAAKVNDRVNEGVRTG